MTFTLDTEKPYTQVGGREPLVYLQGGCGFDRFMNYIGRFTQNGEPLGSAKELYTESVEQAEQPEVVRRKPGRPRKVVL